MKRLIALCATAVLLCPIWANAQVTPQVIGALTWNFNPGMSMGAFSTSLGTYYLNSMTATVTDNGDNTHSLVWKGAFSLSPSLSTPNQALSFSVAGAGGMFLEGSRYIMFVSSTFGLPPSLQILQAGFGSSNVSMLSLSCNLDSTSLSGDCSILAGGSSASASATFVTN